MTGKTYLNVPFPEKDRAKSLGARWDPMERKWFVSVEDLTPFTRWLPTGIVADSAQPAMDLLREEPAAYVVERDPRPIASLTLSQLLQRIQATVETVFEQPVWVRVEINQAKQRNGHWFLELVEHDANGELIAGIQGNLWKSSEPVLRRFQEQTGVALTEGIKLLVAARPRFNPRYGMKLDIVGLDAAYTLGDMAAKLKQIRDALRAEGVFHANKSLRLPGDFFHVAVISPASAASLGDFRAESARLAAFGLCRFHHEEVQFQGPGAAEAIREALARIVVRHGKEPFDAVAIIRGGGSAADLFWLNDEALARAICLCPIPVVTGIGHEPDNTVLDEVACRRCDTPSKVAQLLLTSIANTAEQAEDVMQQLRELALHRLEQTDRRLDDLRQSTQTTVLHALTLANARIEDHGRRLREAAHACLQRTETRLTHLRDQIRQGGLLRLNAAEEYLQERRAATLERARVRLDDAEQTCQQHIRLILALGPEKTLKRGYAVLRHGDRVITQAGHVAPGEEFSVQMQDSRFYARRIT